MGDDFFRSDDLDAAFIEIAQEMERSKKKAQQNFSDKSKTEDTNASIDLITQTNTPYNELPSISPNSIFPQSPHADILSQISSIQKIEQNSDDITGIGNKRGNSIGKGRPIIIEESIDSLFEPLEENITSELNLIPPQITQEIVDQDNTRTYTPFSSINRRENYQNAIFKNYIKMMRR